MAKLSGPIDWVGFSPDLSAVYFVAGYRDNAPAELRRSADGQVVAKLSGPVQYDGVIFSSDPAAAYFVARYSNNIPGELRRTADG